MSPVLHIHVLGELTVTVDGAARALPRSRKTRALIAYLAITGRSHRREALCDLFWDVTDDRRAALRWSPSKIRKTLGPEATPRLVASRNSVALELEGGALDLARLQRAVANLDGAPTEELEALVDGWSGDLLEGMLLPDFDAFEAFLLAERLRARALHVQVRRALVHRLRDQPRRAFVHARAWAQSSDDDEAIDWVARLSTGVADGTPVPSPPATTSPLALAEPVTPEIPLVGRRTIMDRVEACCARVRERRTSGILLLTGEPGMGKTRLLEEVTWRHREQRPAVGAFHAIERGRPLAPFLDLFREQLLPLTAASGDHDLDRDQLFERIAGALRALADEHGLGMLALDDAHLADPASCELIHYLARTTPRTPLLTVLSCRSAELQDNQPLATALAALRRSSCVEEILVGPLSPQDTRTLASADAPPDRLEQVIEDSSGIPLVALEMARMPADAKALPRTLADLVGARLGVLPENVVTVARWVALLESGPLDLLEALAGRELSSFVEVLETAERYRFVRVDTSVPKGRFAASHALVSRAVYEGISDVRRRAMHQAAAEALAEGHHTTDRTATIAHHAERANRPDLMAAALIRGADRTAALGVAREAGEMLEQALALLDGSADDSTVPLEIAALALSLQLERPVDPDPWVERLTTLGLRALDLEEAVAASQAFRAAGRLRWETGDGSEGYGMARKALRSAAGRASGEHVRSSSMVALCLVQLERELPVARAMVLEAEALASARSKGREPSELIVARGLLHLHGGDLDAAFRDAGEGRLAARSERRTVHEALAIQVRMQVALAQGRRAETLRAAEELAELAERIREGPEGALAAAAVGLVEPSLDDAREALGAAATRLREVDDKRALAWMLNRWAGRERRIGAHEAVVALAGEALRAALTVEARSEAAIAASELMASAVQMADDGVFAEAEQTLAELESDGELSLEARERIASLARGQTT